MTAYTMTENSGIPNEPISLENGIFVFMRDGGIRWFSGNNDAYQKWIKTDEVEKASLMLAGKDGVRCMMLDHLSVEDCRDCHGNLDDEVEDALTSGKRRMP